MSTNTSMLITALDLELLHRGKVRDVYKINEETLLLVTTDRISAFDVVMNEGIPNKGFVLSQISAYWFEKNIQNSKVRWLTDAKHLSVLEQQEIFLNEVIGFLKAG